MALHLPMLALNWPSLCLHSLELLQQIRALLLSRLQPTRCQSATFVMPRSSAAMLTLQPLLDRLNWHWFGTSEC